MSDEMSIGGRKYISSKRAADLSDYTQDYIGQLARKGLIDAQRVGGLWYVSMDSLGAYKEKAESYVPVPPQHTLVKDPESLISFDGKDYVSASRAAEITGYHPDYIGQLARGGTVLSRQIGSRWYVERAHIIGHKKEKDGLLAAVQSEAVGIRRPESGEQNRAFNDAGPFFTYTSDDRDLLPISSDEYSEVPVAEEISDTAEEELKGEAHTLPIRIMRSNTVAVEKPNIMRPERRKAERQPRITNKNLVISAMVATIVIVITVGVIVPKEGWVYTQGGIQEGTLQGSRAMAAGVGAAATKIGDLLEEFLAPELIYRRAD